MRVGNDYYITSSSFNPTPVIYHCPINNTGDGIACQSFHTNVVSPLSRRYDVYLRFVGSEADTLFAIQWLRFFDGANHAAGFRQPEAGSIPVRFALEQNFPKSFNASTIIEYTVGGLRLPASVKFVSQYMMSSGER